MEEPMIAFRVSKDEEKYLNEYAKKEGIRKTQLIKFCVHKALINNKISMKEWRERIF